MGYGNKFSLHHSLNFQVLTQFWFITSSNFHQCINNSFFSDVDECATEALPCDHTCTNTPGSYECTCNDGYTSWDNGTCTGTVLVKLDPVNVMTYRL